MSQITQLASKELPSNCFVFKHSTRCPVSFAAADEVKAADAEGLIQQKLYWINVVEQRELSNWVSDLLGVVHQSPQLIKVSDSKAVSEWSHNQVRRAVFRT